VTLILDAGALVAMERGDADVVEAVRRESRAGRPARTHGGVVGQVWRGGSGRQTWLARHLRAVEVVPLDDWLGRRAGVILGRTRTSDVIDAAVVAMAEHGDAVLTSDPGDLLRLIEAARVDATVVPV
jgi:predicted nucleic acid-binding protein